MQFVTHKKPFPMHGLIFYQLFGGLNNVETNRKAPQSEAFNLL